jgi:hypothetical protein
MAEMVAGETVVSVVLDMADYLHMGRELDCEPESVSPRRGGAHPWTLCTNDLSTRPTMTL